MTRTPKITIDYDDVTDMLYFDLGERRPGYYEEGESSPILVKKSRDTGEIIGLLIPDFSIVYKRKIYKYSKLPEPFSYDEIMDIIEKIAKEYNLQ